MDLKIKGISIRYKVAVVLLSTAIASLTIAGAVYHSRSQDLMFALIQDQLTQIASQIEKQINEALSLNDERVALISSRTQLRKSLSSYLSLNESKDSKEKHIQRIHNILIDAKNSIPEILALTVTNSSGLVLQSTDRSILGTDIDTRWLTIDENANAAKASVIIWKRNGKSTLMFGGLLKLDGKVIGQMLVEVNTDSLEKALHTATDNNTSIESILTQDQTHPEPIIFSQSLRFSSHNISKIFNHAKASTNDDILEIDIDSNQTSLAIVKEIERTGWQLILTIDKTEALYLLTKQREFLIISLTAIVLLLLLVSLMIGNRITAPIIDMAYIAHLISSGDFSKRIQNLTKDELGVLGTTLNRMADSLLSANKELEIKVKEKTVSLEKANQHLFQLNEELTLLSQRDPLTKAFNRRAFDAALTKEVKRAYRDNTTLTLLLLDIDFFKQYNDALGHQRGDECLIQVVETLFNCVKREGDVVARYGGEEFAVLLPNTELEAAITIANSIQSELKAKMIKHPTSEVSSLVTVSVGLSQLRHDQDKTQERLIEEADIALYRAKDKGRNRVEIHAKSKPLD